MKNQKDKLAFFGLIVAIITLISIHYTPFLLTLCIVFTLLSFKTAIKTFKAVLFFNASVTIGYIIESLFVGRVFLEFLLLFNLRVFDITFLTLFVSSKINLIQAVSFSKSLQFLLTATLSQIQSFRKTFEDFQLALASRSVKTMTQKGRKNFVSSMFFFFLKKSLHNSHERTLALKARGFFD